MKTETTPAPWSVGKCGNEYFLLTECHPYDILALDNMGDDIAKANAKLASQAPVLKELVEKQQEYIKFLESYANGIMAPIYCDGKLKFIEKIEQLKNQLK